MDSGQIDTYLEGLAAPTGDLTLAGAGWQLGQRPAKTTWWLFTWYPVPASTATVASSTTHPGTSAIEPQLVQRTCSWWAACAWYRRLPEPISWRWTSDFFSRVKTALRIVE